MFYQPPKKCFQDGIDGQFSPLISRPASGVPLKVVGLPPGAWRIYTLVH